VRDAYAQYDAEQKFPVANLKIADPKACQCGEVLKGVIKPHECKVFGTACTPETPLGSLMVSSEGACAAYFNYGRIDTSGLRRPRSATQSDAEVAAGPDLRVDALSNPRTVQA
jgi:hydrogenase expression/formation protein HypD